MQPTNRNALREIAHQLETQFVGNRDQVVTELSLLTTWAFWSYRYMGGVEFHEQQPDIGYAYTEISKCLPAGHVFSRSRLYDACPAPFISQLVKLLNMPDWKNGARIAEDLLDVVRELALVDDLLLSNELGELVASLARSTSASTDSCTVVLHHGMSVSALPYLAYASDVSVRVQQVAPLYVAVCYLLDVPLEERQSIFDSGPDRADIVISAPPFGGVVGDESYRYTHEAGVLCAAEEATSRSVILVPPGFLFQRSSSTIRKELIEQNHVEAVISLPKGQLKSMAVSPVLLVLDKCRASGDPIQFYNWDGAASKNGYQRLAKALRCREPGGNGALSSTDKIREHKYDLSVNRYCLGDATAAIAQIENAVTLNGVADIIRAQSLKSEGVDPDAPGAILEVAVKDISDSGLVFSPEKSVMVDEKQKGRVGKQKVRSGDILLAIKGSVGRVGIVGYDCGDNWVAGQAFLIIRPKKSLSTEYLYRYLSSGLVQSYLAEVSTGTAMKLLKASDVEDIPVPLPDAETRAKVEENHRAIQAEYAAIQEHRDRIERLAEEHWSLNAEHGGL